ncbi:hypothetical protein VZH09_05980 [Synechococcus elongatus IITB7]|uniref:hypothetical protein n=1 Tax=Synechococcus elongatus TaxID=32046 RepID=UPI0030CE3AA0
MTRQRATQLKMNGTQGMSNRTLLNAMTRTVVRLGTQWLLQETRDRTTITIERG